MSYALELAEENRPELEKVLNHYKQTNKKKYDAACFLISNMRYHKSKQILSLDNSYHSFFTQTDSLYNTIFSYMDISLRSSFKPNSYDETRKNNGETFSHLPKPEIKVNSLCDLQVITAEFLIDNIEKAFEEWENNPLLRNMDFEDFKEFVLPYRTSNEELFIKRSLIQGMWKKEIERDGFSNIDKPLNRYKIYVEKCRWLNHYLRPKDHIGIYDLFIPKFKMDCHNMTNWSCNILRACGIPAVYEYTPQWKDRSNRHFWCVSPDSTGILQPYTAPDNNLREDWLSDIMYAGKVYRKGFAANKKSPYFLKSDDEYIPEELALPIIKDQTCRYHQTVTLKMPFSITTENNLAYLCMFNGYDLIPVGWGTINHNSKEISFEQVPINTVFIPVYYIDDEPISFSSPFILHSSENLLNIPKPLTVNKIDNEIICRIKDGQLQSNNTEINSRLKYQAILPNNKSEDMKIFRKYPEKRKLKALQSKLIGAYFTGSNDEKKNYDTLFTLMEAPIPYLQQIKLKNKKAYRYYRFFTSDKSPVNIAHMEFLSDRKNFLKYSKPTPLPIFSINDTNTIIKSDLYCLDGIPLKTGSKPEVAFDGDFETFVGSSSIGMDFTNPVEITHVRFIPRNANNGINPGETYRLNYHDGRTWEEHSTQTAEYNYLHFKNVPSNTLYWLENLSKGKDELPFFHQDGKQYFMNIETIH